MRGLSGCAQGTNSARDYRLFGLESLTEPVAAIVVGHLSGQPPSTGRFIQWAPSGGTA